MTAAYITMRGTLLYSRNSFLDARNEGERTFLRQEMQDIVGEKNKRESKENVGPPLRKQARITESSCKRE